MAGETAPSLAEAYNQFLSTLKESQRQSSQQDLIRFVQWFGKDTPVTGLTPRAMEDYAERLGTQGADTTLKLKPVKGFLTYLNTQGLVSTSLAPHLRPPKAKGRVPPKNIGAGAEQTVLTAEGYARLTAQLDTLKQERVKVVEDIQRAMADKDFRENAPLDAAKERQGFAESQIRELEATLQTAIVAAEAKKTFDQRATLGKRVTLKDTATGRRITYTLVDAREAEPSLGKISRASPVGKALLDKGVGENVSIKAPRGTFSYIIERIES